MRWLLRVPTVVVVALAAGAIAVAIPSGPVGATEAAAADCPRSAGDVEQAQRLRRVVGLPDRSDLVAASFSLPGYSCELAGIPLSPDEEAAFLDVLDAQAELSDLHESVAGDPTFAGAWLDAGTLIVASTDGKLGGDFYPKKGSIELRVAQFTQRELDDAGAEIGQLTVDSAIGSLAADVTYVAIDVRANQVNVGVAADVQQAAWTFAKIYGDLVSVSFAEAAEGGFLVCSVNGCGTKGGLAMNHSNPAVQCTTGFLAKSKPWEGGAYARRILTAGHCIYGAGGVTNTVNWRSPDGTQVWGPNLTMDFQQYDYYDIHDGTRWCPVVNVLCLYNDLGLIGVGSNPPADWNQYYTGSGSFIEIDGSTTKSNQLVGQVVYRYGRTSFLDAGAITAKLPYKTFTGDDCGAPGYTCRSYNVIEVGVGSDHGDSGSGFYRVQSNGQGGYIRNAYGILSGGVEGQPYTYYYAWNEPFYAGVYKTDPRLVYPCISTSCPL
jgi:hypothetical protein